MGQEAFAHLIVVFCRVAGLIMVFPALGSQRIPARVKIALAVFMTLIIAPGLAPAVTDINSNPFVLIREVVTGIALGLAVRLIYYAAETAGNIISMMIGLSNAFSGANEESEALPILATFLSLAVTMMVFASDMHHLMIIGARKTYDILPLSSQMDMQGSLINIVEALRKSSVLALQVSAPFIIIGMIANLTAGILNRIVQQVPIYFVFTPLVTLAGLVVLWAVSAPMILNISAAMIAELR